ncbi:MULTISPECIES: Cof-type HAD-IIB family hydrolase [Aestuariimicrobium]|uniref:Cof-type HAD-IIB family hydrolase n=1 Tax=Aestuariimicrobium TaxID=396388 RepID=UPI0003B358E6|nr:MULTISPECIES: Cof-type HAD-IIB family hydrolase [Aestuariimicrobium]CAI9402499.1 5-amino-6-(5-phospho-D-ribitylamino)uracil phosphatase YitU [Aestuariimicrobium sp. T2.26MG-19.2B]
MSFRPRLVALDIDGTLLSHDGVLPDPVREAVGRVVDAGVPVVLATGRGWFSTEPVVHQLGLPRGVHVSSNGAVVVHYPPFDLRVVQTFDPGPVIRRVNELAPNAAIAVEVIGTGYRITKPFPDGDLQGEMIIESVEQLCAEPASRVVIRDPDAPIEEFEELAQHVGLHGVSYAIGWSTWLDIAPLGVNKASGLAQVADDLGVDRADVLAIGDGFNDLEMLQWAGRGVAMGNAPTGVHEVADDVTGDFDDHGTAAELDRWFG